MAAALSPLNLTHAQFVLLASVWYLGSLGEQPSQRELADHAGTDVMMTSEVARVLEAKGLIRRDPDPDDARAYRLQTTTTGRRSARRAIVAVEAADRVFFESATDQARLISTLRTLAGRDAAGDPIA